MFNLFKPKFSIEIVRIENLLKIIVNVNNRKISSMKCVIKDKSILIGDIEPYQNNKYFNKGYGTMMMDELFSYAKQNDFNEIYGYLSNVDIDHKDRLLHFYKKFGFKIELYDITTNGNFGEIRIFI